MAPARRSGSLFTGGRDEHERELDASKELPEKRRSRARLYSSVSQRRSDDGGVWPHCVYRRAARLRAASDLTQRALSGSSFLRLPELAITGGGMERLRGGMEARGGGLEAPAVRLPIAESRGSAVTVGACLSVVMGGMWYFKEDAEKPASLKQIYQEEALEEETIEEKAMKNRFEDWMIKYDRNYKDKEEKAMRYELFKLTAQHVDENNVIPGTLCTLGTNQFADFTEEEFIWSCGGPRSIISGKEIMRRGYL
ncbi:hypothetical protein D1007_02828 [Hordeum vulgare]|nr:hypothetical protein D1007_02828 [Hordeum vulgare]